MRCNLVVQAIGVWIGLVSVAFSQQRDAPLLARQREASANEFFERDIRPLLLEHCSGCHSQKVGKVMGGLNLDSREGLLSGGDSGPAVDFESPNQSLLLEAVRRESFEMPPEKPLSRQQIELLGRWIRDGAVWPESHSPPQGDGDWVAERAATHWAWQPIDRSARNRDSEIRATSDWTLGAIDTLVLARLQQVGLEPSQRANSDELLRRLSFDLTGLPPTLEQIQHFEQLVASGPQLAYERLVDHLLSSPQFGVQWGRHWLDLVRYAETLGHEFDFPIRHAWRYRDAVIDSLNDDTPYNQFVVDHLAGDLAREPRVHPWTGVDQSLALTGWWWMGDSIHAPVDIKNDWATRLENQIDVLSKTFFGMTVACARCHDHKFDAIRTDDYYGLAGIVRSTRRHYAATDPQERIAEHLNALQTSWKAASHQAMNAWQSVTRESVQGWMDHLSLTWSSLTPEDLDSRLPIGSPLHPLRLLIPTTKENVDPEVEFANRVSAMRERLEMAASELDAWQSESRLLADFSNGIPKDWKVATLGNLIDAEVDWFDGELPLPVRSSAFSSSLMGRHQVLTLRSPNFQVSEPILAIRVRGKSTRSIITIDNYFMAEFHGLLFDDLQKPIDQPDDWGWVTHSGDLSKYIGHTAFVSLEKDSGAWFEVAEVRAAHRLPPVQPHPWAIDLLHGDPSSRAVFEKNMAERLHRALFHGPSEVARSMLRIEPEMLLGPEPASELRNLAGQLQRLDRQTPEPTLLIAAEEGSPENATIDLRGNPHQPGDVVPRTCFPWLPSWRSPEEQSSGRRELAQSLVDPQHPLVARAMVNRVWHHLMGSGLVASPDNLGVLGSRPTHPELLDWLACEFIEHDWSIKWLVREIVTSQTYQLSSTPTEFQREHDADARLWSHRSVRRLSAENLRDAILLTCDSLDERLGGPSVPVHLTEQMTGRGRPLGSGPLDGDNRRSIYIEVRRNFLSPFLLAFDFPMPSSTTGRRNNSNVPAQALSLLNDPLILEMSRRWTAATESTSDPEQRIRTLIQTAFARPATEDEVHQCLELVQESGPSGWEDLGHTLLNAKAFWYLK